MSFNANDLPRTKTKAPLLDAGAYPARIAQVVSLGVQKQRPFKGEEKAPIKEILLTYELLDEFLKDVDGNDDLKKPRFFSDRLPWHRLEADRAKSTKRYYALDPEVKFNGDFSKLLNMPCIVTLTKDVESGYNNISNVSAMREKEAAKAPPLVNPAILFDFYDPDPLVFDKLQDWIKDVIKGALDYNGGKASTEPSSDTTLEEDLEDEIPY